MGGFAQEMAKFVENPQKGTAPNFDRPHRGPHWVVSKNEIGFEPRTPKLRSTVGLTFETGKKKSWLDSILMAQANS